MHPVVCACTVSVFAGKDCVCTHIVHIDMYICAHPPTHVYTQKRHHSTQHQTANAPTPRSSGARPSPPPSPRSPSTRRRSTSGSTSPCPRTSRTRASSSTSTRRSRSRRRLSLLSRVFRTVTSPTWTHARGAYSVCIYVCVYVSPHNERTQHDRSPLMHTQIYNHIN